MRNSPLYQYLRGLKKAKGNQQDANIAQHPKRKNNKIIISIMTLMLSANGFLPFGEQVTYASDVDSENAIIHVVEKGDTLYNLSKRYKVNISSIKEANHLSSNAIELGKKLLISTKTKTAPLRQVSNGTTNAIYNPNIPIKREYQEYLYKVTQERGLDYQKTLAVVFTESSFKINARSDSSYGLFQINRIHHKSLAKTLKTANKPFDAYVNINWGTYMLSDLYKYWKSKGITGQKLDEYVWSSYNLGVNGFKKNGKATSYVKKMNKNIPYIHSLFK